MCIYKEQQIKYVSSKHRTFEAIALQSDNSRKIDLYSDYMENYLNTLS